METIKVKATQKINLGKIGGKISNFEEGDTSELPLENPTVQGYIDNGLLVPIEGAEDAVSFDEELKDIKGIGKKTAEDISEVADDMEEAKELAEEGEISLRDDVKERLLSQ